MHTLMTIDENLSKYNGISMQWGRVMLLSSEYWWCKYWCRLMQVSSEYHGIYICRGLGDAGIRLIPMIQISMQIDADFEWILWSINAGGWLMMLLGEYWWFKYQCRLMQMSVEHWWEYQYRSMQRSGKYWWKYQCRCWERLQTNV